jgi:hypothetical protein
VEQDFVVFPTTIIIRKWVKAPDIGAHKELAPQMADFKINLNC